MNDFEFPKEMMCPEDIENGKYDLFKEIYKEKYYIIKDNCPHASRILEIGVRAGYSAWTFLQCCPDAEYIGLDPHNGTHGGKGGEDGKYERWAEKILEPHYFHLYQVDTQTGDTKVYGKFDFIHVDGDHTAIGVWNDMNLCFPMLNDSRSCMLVDDYDYLPAVKEGVDEWLDDNPDIGHIKIDTVRGDVLIWNRK